MFSGIVEEVGIVVSTDVKSPQEGLTIRARDVLDGTRVGDSIAVNGACLTVTRLDGDRFTAGVVAETLRRTNLGDLAAGDSVNLERSVRPTSRLGGHFVQGHVDGVGTVLSVVPDGTAQVVRIQTSPELLRYIVEKGFIAVDGASLTVTQVDDHSFSVALIPFTQEHIAGGLMQRGYRANLEVDILAKYVEKLVVH